MSRSKNFNKIAWCIAVLTLVLCIVFMFSENLGIAKNEHVMGYETRLFDTERVHTIDIVMDDWDSFISTCENEEYSSASLVIDGENYKNVAIRGKGNTSLSNVSSRNSERYSFKVEFDHYDSTKTYYGLDKLSLNNLIQDNTMMKDYLTYRLMNEFEVASPLCSFVYITVNGQDWGLYLAVEGVEDSFLERNYSAASGELYKPDSMSFGGGRGNGKEFNADQFFNSEENTAQDSAETKFPDKNKMRENVENFDAMRENFGKGGFGGGMGSLDVKLQYIDSNPESYQNIFANAKTDLSEEDKVRLIEALKKLSQQNVEECVDIESVIRYFAVHNYVCNGDSYTGSMIHNYYLFESDGKLSMIPWDYNLAFGTFQSSDATSTVNSPIDTPVSGSDMSDRPMIAWIFANEEYTELYHTLFKDFLEIDTQKIIEDAYLLIREYVKKDPTKFCTFEEFEKGVETLAEFCSLRSESVALQLDGAITSTSDGQKENSTALVDASHITISDMGSMGMGGTFKGGRGNNPFTGEENAQKPPFENMMPPDGNTQMPEGFPSGGFEERENPASQMPEAAPPENTNRGEFPQDFRGNEDFTPQAAEPSENGNELVTLLVCAIVLIGVIILAKVYKRH